MLVSNELAMQCLLLRVPWSGCKDDAEPVCWSESAWAEFECCLDVHGTCDQAWASLAVQTRPQTDDHSETYTDTHI